MMHQKGQNPRPLLRRTFRVQSAEFQKQLSPVILQHIGVEGVDCDVDGAAISFELDRIVLQNQGTPLPIKTARERESPAESLPSLLQWSLRASDSIGKNLSGTPVTVIKHNSEGISYLPQGAPNNFYVLFIQVRGFQTLRKVIGCNSNETYLFIYVSRKKTRTERRVNQDQMEQVFGISCCAKSSKGVKHPQRMTFVQKFLSLAIMKGAIDHQNDIVNHVPVPLVQG